MSDDTTVSVEVDLNLDGLADSLSWFSDQDTLFKFIVTLDENIADYDFTARLAKKFTKLKKKEDKAFKQGEKDRSERYGW